MDIFWQIRTRMDNEEFRVLLKTLDSFNSYGEDSKRHLVDPRVDIFHGRARNDIALTAKHKELLQELGYKDHLQKVTQAIDSNQAFFDLVLAYSAQHFIPSEDDKNGDAVSPIKDEHNSIKAYLEETLGKYAQGYHAMNMDRDKVRSILKQVAREWTAEGAYERQIINKPIFEWLEKLYPDKDARKDIRIVCPGCGLGRLPFDLCTELGFQAQGNEFSFHMLLVSNFIINIMQQPNCLAVHPFVNSFSNVKSRDIQIRPVIVPDLAASQLLSESDLFSMTSGSFEHVYPLDSYKANCVVTCFFIDTANNIFRYLETIADMLSAGEHWINIGPLLWHFEDDANNIELSVDELKLVIPKFGFEIVHWESIEGVPYSSDLERMGGYRYDVEFWVAKKV